MNFKLRDYQELAKKAGINYCRSTNEPGIMSMSVGSGKTVIIKELGKHVINLGGQVLSIAHTTELVESAVKTFGDDCYLYSNGYGEKTLNSKMIFASEKSIVNVLHKLQKIDLLLLDECHRLADDKPDSVYMRIINKVLTVNPKCRVIGLTGTAERLGTGAIYGANRFFKKIIYEVNAGFLLKQNYLCKVVTSQSETKQYSFEEKTIYTNKYLDSIVKSSHRITKHIVDDIIEKTRNRNKVLIYGSTLEHCNEIQEYFHANGIKSLVLSSRINTAKRKEVLNDFHFGDCKFLINKDILTTGYDFPQCDAIALLRPSESKSLIQQIIGRIMRLHKSKTDALFLDYAGNLDRHGSLDSLFSGENAKVKTKREKDNDEQIQCPACGYLNKSTARKCKCGFYFISKTCPDCDKENDITTRYCGCGTELVNPGDSLFAIASNGDEIFRAKVVNTSLTTHHKNKKCLRVEIMTDDIQNNYPMISQFIAEGSNHLKHWIHSHIKDGISPEPFYDSIDMILNCLDDFVMDEIVSYKKKGRYFQFIKD